MKKRAKKISKLKVPKPSEDIKFDRPLVFVLSAALIMLLCFVVYHYKTNMPQEFPEETLFLGDECTIDMDCLQPKCPGMEGICEDGYCIIQQTGPTAAKCIDLSAPVCGNDICEADEKDICSTDCGSDEIEGIEICNNDENCEINLVEKGYSENEDYKNCADCWCGDLICDDKEKLDNNCPEDCIH